jgi:hypothetical protein
LAPQSFFFFFVSPNTKYKKKEKETVGFESHEFSTAEW